MQTEAAKELALRYEEIMIDEYQDSNEVQELILTSISRRRPGKEKYFHGGGCETEHLPVPHGKAGAVYGEI